MWGHSIKKKTSLNSSAMSVMKGPLHTHRQKDRQTHIHRGGTNLFMETKTMTSKCNVQFLTRS